MQHAVEIENIEQMRRREGIIDVDLHKAIRALRVGDVVRLTFVTETAPPTAETLAVRITRIQGSDFRGKLADNPLSVGLAALRRGSGVAFTWHHIHSLPKGQPVHER